MTQDNEDCWDHEIASRHVTAESLLSVTDARIGLTLLWLLEQWLWKDKLKAPFPDGVALVCVSPAAELQSWSWMPMLSECLLSNSSIILMLMLCTFISLLSDTTAEIGRAATGETKCSTAGRILELTRHAGISLGYLSNVCPLPMYAQAVKTEKSHLLGSLVSVWVTNSSAVRFYCVILAADSVKCHGFWMGPDPTTVCDHFHIFQYENSVLEIFTDGHYVWCRTKHALQATPRRLSALSQAV